MKRKRPEVPELSKTNLRRVCFQLDELVELRTYEQVEADLPSDAEVEGPVPTIKDMTIINPYASSTPLDRADLYLQCCKVYKLEPHAQIVKQFRAKGPRNATFEGPRTFELRDVKMTKQDTIALADCLGLPLTGKHLTEVVLDNCDLSDESLQLLLSCIYSSAKLESLDVSNNSGLTFESVKNLISFLCLSPQLQRFAWQGSQMDSRGVQLLIDALTESKIMGLEELSLAGAQMTDDDLARLIPVARKAGVIGFGICDTKLSSAGVQLIAPLLRGPNGLHALELAHNDLSSSLSTLISGLDSSSPLVSLDIQHCRLEAAAIKPLLQKLTQLPNFRRLQLSGQNLQAAIPVFKSELPRMPIIRRLGLAHCNLNSQDVVTLCEVVADLKISQLILTGVQLDASAMSALYAAARVSKTLISLEIDIPKDAYGEKIGRRILAECIRNMETQEGSLDVTDTDMHASVVLQHQRLTLSRQKTNRHEELTHGAHGVAQALSILLSTKEDEQARDLPKDMYERARYMRQKIEPALSEHMEPLQKRRLLLVVETLDQVIRRFESIYPEYVDPMEHVTPSPHEQEVFEHSGRPRPDYLPVRNGKSGARSKVLETEEGEMMKLAHRMTDRLNILKTSASASRTPSRDSSREELEDAKEAAMLEQLNAADGNELKEKLHALQASGFNRPLGNEIK